MDRAPPQQKRMMIIAGSALALGAAAFYYVQPRSLHPETAAKKNVTTEDKRVDTNTVAQSVDVREQAK